MVRPLIALVVLLCQMASLSADEQSDADAQRARKEHYEKFYANNERSNELRAEMVRIEKFYKDHRDDLPTILAEKDKSLMLGGYWMYLNRNNANVKHYDRMIFGRTRMIGMLSGVTKVSFPQWWEFSLVVGRGPVTMYTNPRVTYNKEYVDIDYGWPRSLTEDGKERTKPLNIYRQFSLSDKVTLVRELTDRTVFRLNDKPFAIDFRQLPEGKEYNRLAVARGRGRSFVLVYDARDASPKKRMLLYAFRRDGMALWKTEVFGAVDSAWYSGAGSALPWRCELLVSKTSVIVIGANWVSTFLESFALDDGHTEFHFSTAVDDTPDPDEEENENQ